MTKQLQTQQEKIKKLEEKLKAIKKEAAKTAKLQKAKEQAELLKMDNRKNMLAGEAILSAVKNGKFEKEKFDEIMSFHLKDQEDKKLFGLL